MCMSALCEYVSIFMSSLMHVNIHVGVVVVVVSVSVFVFVCFSKHVHHAEPSEHDLALPDLIRPATSIQKTHFSTMVCVFKAVCISGVDAYTYYYEFILSAFTHSVSDL